MSVDPNAPPDQSRESTRWSHGQVAYEFPALLARTAVITCAAAGAAAAHVSARWGCPVVAKPFTGPELVGAIVGLNAE